MKKFIPFLAGLAAALTIVLITVPAFADSVLPGTSATITVRYSTIKTIINGKEFVVPSDDMIPFSYNDRTYVSLKFIAEAFGKDIKWDQATNAAIINDPLPFTNVYSDPMTTIPMSSDWVKNGTVHVDADNGCFLEGDTTLSLNKYYKKDARNFTVEFDYAAKDTDYMFGGTTIYIGRSLDGDKSDYVEFNDHHLYLNGQMNAYPHGILLDNNEYHHIAIDVKDGMIHVYIDGTYIVSGGHLGNEIDIQYCADFSYNYGCYIRNFKLTVNE